MQEYKCKIKYLDGFPGYKNQDKTNPRTNINAFSHCVSSSFFTFAFFSKKMMERLSNVNISFTNNNK